MSQKICVLTGSRADYGLLREVMRNIQSDPELSLQVVVTGMHLSPEFGFTCSEIESDGFVISRKVETLLSSDSAVGTSKAMGLGLIGFADVLDDLRPDLVVVLGDRFEIFPMAIAALVSRIPIAHIHGGETTEAAFDEAIRHSITKMSTLHFVAAEAYRKRVIQLGENPDGVHLVGGLGVDALNHLELIGRSELEKTLGFKFNNKNLLITFHPVTLEEDAASAQIIQLLEALGRLKETELIFTFPNADEGGRSLIRLIEDFSIKNPNTHIFSSLGQLLYFSCVAQVDGVVGNSSSGLLEVPSFKKGTINIGDRQRGRLMSESVINCGPTQQEITEAILMLYSTTFQEKLKKVVNLYGSGGASKKILKVIKNFKANKVLNKRFHDL